MARAASLGHFRLDDLGLESLLSLSLRFLRLVETSLGSLFDGPLLLHDEEVSVFAGRRRRLFLLQESFCLLLVTAVRLFLEGSLFLEAC